MSKESCHSCCNIAALTGYTGQEEVEATRHLFLRLSLGLMRRNAALLMWAVSVRFVSFQCIKYISQSNVQWSSEMHQLSNFGSGTSQKNTLYHNHHRY